METIKQASDLLQACRSEGTEIPHLPATMRPASHAEAYAIQKQAETPAEPRVGWKIAATSTAGQKHIGVSGPIIGRITKGMMLAEGVPVPMTSNRMRVAEAEFVFEFSKTITPRPQPYAREDALDLISALRLGLEFPNSRYTHFETAGELALIADNACAHQFMLGPVAPDIWRDLALSDHLVTGQVARADKDEDADIYEGAGANVLGDPRQALVWFLNEAAAQNITIDKGDFVTTGTSTLPMPFQAGNRIAADFGRLGKMRCQISN